jgi:hypothetical protein
MHSRIHQVVFPSTWGNIGTDLGHSQPQVTKSAHDSNRNSKKYPYEKFLHLRSFSTIQITFQHTAMMRIRTLRKGPSSS